MMPTAKAVLKLCTFDHLPSSKKGEKEICSLLKKGNNRHRMIAPKGKLPTSLYHGEIFLSMLTSEDV